MATPIRSSLVDRCDVSRVCYTGIGAAGRMTDGPIGSDRTQEMVNVAAYIPVLSFAPS